MVRVIAVFVGLSAFICGIRPAGAESTILWPCEVTVSIEAGPWRNAALGAVRQLDAASVIEWPIVEDGMVTVGWSDLPAPTVALATVSADDQRKVAGRVDVDPDMANRWVMLSLLHELGHVAGLDHNDDERSVMNASDVPWRKFQPVDLARLAGIDCG